MQAPVICEETKKPQTRVERSAASKDEASINVRAKVADLIKKVVNENAPTWKELAKR